MENEIAYIGLGSNLGNRQKYISDAINLLKRYQGISLQAISPIYETTPVGYIDQPDFLNCVAKISTTLTPKELLWVCMDIENVLERKRTIKWGARTLDLDILFYGALMYEDEQLTIPHPLLHERAFVLVPLIDIAPNIQHPKLNVSIRELYEIYIKTNGKSEEIKRFGDFIEGCHN